MPVQQIELEEVPLVVISDADLEAAVVDVNMMYSTPPSTCGMACGK